MHDDVVDRLHRDLAARAGMSVTRREPLRVWRLSGIERLHLADGSTVIFKYADEPFTSEDVTLALAAEHGVPVPTLHASAIQEHTLGMIMEDLGAPLREADDGDGARAAVTLHQVPCLPSLPTIDTDHLVSLPRQGLNRLATLTGSGRWADVDDIADMLGRIGNAAETLADGAHLPPYGLCHSEFHPTSLHIGGSGWRLLDFARAFNGPGLLDLASWPGTIDDPEPAKLRSLIETYIAAGGHPNALASRGGLAAERWALGWHRVWVISWYLDQAVRWINDPSTDPTYIAAVRRHLGEAVHLLEA